MPGNEDPTAVAELITTPTSPLPTRLGDFELLSKLGEGGMGEVWRARHVRLDRVVALKLLSPRIAADAESRQRFIREMEAVGRVNHPRVVTCYSAGQVDGRVFMELQLMPGGDALNLLRSHGGSLHEVRALELIKDCAEGLCALEKVGLVHRDIKPGNVFIDAEGRAKLGDLGLAREESGGDRITRTGLIVGTPAYMAPEQASGDVKLDTRADVWALGATLFHLLTGRPPFVGPTAMRIVSQVLSAQAPDPGSLVPELAPGTRTLVRKMLARERDERFATAAELVAAIERATRGAKAASELGKRAVVRSPSGRRIVSASDLPTLPPRRGGLRLWPWLVAAAGLGAVAMFGFPGRERSADADTLSAARPAPASPPRRAVAPRTSIPVEPETAPAIPEPEPAAREPEPADEPEASLPEPALAPVVEAPVEAAPESAPLRGLVSRIEARDGGQAWHTGNDVFRFGRVERPFARVSLVSPYRLSKQWGKSSGAMAWWRLSNLSVARSVTTDVVHLQDEGFRCPAGLFFELGLRSSDQPVSGARDLTGQAVWLSLLVDVEDRVWVLPRAIDRAASGPLTPRAKGVWVRDPLASFTFDRRMPLEVEVKVETGRGALLFVKQGRECRFQRMIGDLPAGCLSLGRGAYPWTHFGNWDGGLGTAQVEVGSWAR